MGEMESLPPGFRFHPTDEELVIYYLVNKVKDRNFTGRAITEVDLNKCEPWHLPEKAKVGEKEWYFYSLRDRKYPTGLRTNRATESGYWKATGKDREIYSSTSSALVGMKKTLVFYKGRAPKGEKTNWVMHEYRLDGKLSYRQLSSSSKDEWVLTRVFQKSSSSSGFFGGKKGFSSGEDGNSLYYNALMQPPLMISEQETSRQHVPCFSTANSDLLLDSHGGGGDGPDLVNGSMDYLQMVQDSKYPHVSSSFNTTSGGTGGGVWDGGMGVSSSWLFSNNMGGVGSGSSCQMVKYGVENGGGFASGVQEMSKFGVGREGLKDAMYGSSFGYV